MVCFPHGQSGSLAFFPALLLCLFFLWQRNHGNAGEELEDFNNTQRPSPGWNDLLRGRLISWEAFLPS